MAGKEELDKIRCLIDTHIYDEDRKDNLAIQAERSAGLAEHYKKEGFLKDAVGEMKRSLSLTRNEGYELILSGWERELDTIEKECPYNCGQRLSGSSIDTCSSCSRLINVCASCHFPNRYLDPFCRHCGDKISKTLNENHRLGNFTKTWFHSMAFDAICHASTIVGDVIVLPAVNDGGLLAMKVSNGEIVWKVSNIGVDQNTKIMFCYPYIYLFSSRVVQRIMMGLDTITPEINYSVPQDYTDHPTFPLSYGKTIYFPVEGGLFIHNIFRKSGSLMQLSENNNRNIFPVKSGKDIFVVSQKGNIYKLTSDKLELHHTIPSFEIISPPISSVNGKWIYFEGYKDGNRMINALKPDSNTILSKQIPDAYCSVDDIHFHSPPVLYKDGVLIISSQEPMVYYAKCIGNDMDLKEMRIDISTGLRKVLNIEALFSLFTDPLFISHIPDGFFYINMDEKTESGIEFFGSELMGRPLIFNNKLILICKDGVRCYAF